MAFAWSTRAIVVVILLIFRSLLILIEQFVFLFVV